MADDERGEAIDLSEDLHKNSGPARRGMTFKCVKKTAGTVFSHLGLAALVVAYTILGGFIFRYLEAPNESKEKLRIVEFKSTMVTELHQLASHLCLQTLDKANFTDTVAAMLLQFQQQVTVAVKDNGWDGKDETDESALQWSFAGALLYAVTVVTTIGYGHIAPKTHWGRMVTIVYALLGIPLTFLYLSNMGNLMAKCFRIFYQKVCCGLCIYRSHLLDQWRCCPRRSSNDVISGSVNLDPRRAISVLVEHYNKSFDFRSMTSSEQCVYPDSSSSIEPEMTSNDDSYELPTHSHGSGRNRHQHKQRNMTTTTRDLSAVNIGGMTSSNNFAPRDASSDRPEVTWSPTTRMRRRIVWRRRLSVDSAIESSSCWRCRHPVTLTVDKATDKPPVEWLDEQKHHRRRLDRHHRKSKTKHNGLSKAVHAAAFGNDPPPLDFDAGGMMNKNTDISNHIGEVSVTVPISICLIIIAAYVSVGSLMFTIWEEWDYLAGCYFCFITLSTIGFGDLVPGTGMKEWAAHEKLVLCAIYLAFGLSMLAMCFNLMQEEVRDKLHWIGRKLGLAKDSEHDDNSDYDDDD